MSNCSWLYQINLVKVKLVFPKLVKVPNVGENGLFFSSQETNICNTNTRTTYEIWSKLTLKMTERRHYRYSGVFIVKSEHISHLCSICILELNIHLVGGFQTLADTFLLHDVTKIG